MRVILESENGCNGYSRQFEPVLVTAAIRQIADPGEGSVRFPGSCQLCIQVRAIRMTVSFARIW